MNNPDATPPLLHAAPACKKADHARISPPHPTTATPAPKTPGSTKDRETRASPAKLLRHEIPLSPDPSTHSNDTHEKVFAPHAPDPSTTPTPHANSPPAHPTKSALPPNTHSPEKIPPARRSTHTSPTPPRIPPPRTTHSPPHAPSTSLPSSLTANET